MLLLLRALGARAALRSLPAALRPPPAPGRSPALPAPGRLGHSLRGARLAGHGGALPGGRRPRRPRRPRARAAPARAHVRLAGVLDLPASPAPGPLGGRGACAGRSPAQRPHPGAAGAAGERGGPLRPRPHHRLPAGGPAPGPAPARRLLPAGAADFRVHRAAGAGRGAGGGQHAQGALRLPAPAGRGVLRRQPDGAAGEPADGRHPGVQVLLQAGHLPGPAQRHPDGGLLRLALPALAQADRPPARGAARAGGRRGPHRRRPPQPLPPGAGAGNPAPPPPALPPPKGPRRPPGARAGAVPRRPPSPSLSPQVAKATGVADEVLGNVRTVRAFAMEDQQAGLYCAEVDRAGWLNERLGLGIAAFQGLSNVALNGIVLGTIFVGGSLMAGDELSPGDLMSFLVASQTVQRSMANISILLGQVVRGLSAGARVFELLTLEPSVALKGGSSIPSHSLLGRICFDRVSFSYPTRPGYLVLRDFSLTLPPCKTVAIVGPSGGGKSTVAALLERFYEPTQGTITLDGHDISSLDPSWLRGQVIGFISQEPVLFGTTIMENIRFGKPGASDAEVYAAAQLANADGFIRSFPEGYDTVVGERGTALSGGQKQRIAIARALLKDPAILILDEATSALDAQSEKVVQEALDRAVSGRTVLVIAHRLSTIRGADLVVVLAQGRVAEAGTHEELVRRGGLYAELIRRQSKDRS